MVSVTFFQWKRGWRSFPPPKKQKKTNFCPKRRDQLFENVWLLSGVYAGIQIGAIYRASSIEENCSYSDKRNLSIAPVPEWLRVAAGYICECGMGAQCRAKRVNLMLETFINAIAIILLIFLLKISRNFGYARRRCIREGELN